MKKLALLLPLLSILGCNSGTEANSQELRFSAIPDQNSTELVEKYNKIASYLSDELDITVTYVPSSDYSASVEAFKSGEVSRERPGLVSPKVNRDLFFNFIFTEKKGRKALPLDR